jgi:hypothetical protein
MPRVEIDEAELQRSTSARQFVETIWNNPKARRKLLEAQREVKPDDPMVKELDKPEPVDERFAALEKRLEEERKARIEAEAKREQDEKIGSLKAKRDDGLAQLRGEGWTDKGIEGVTKIMEEKGILDPLDAAAIWEKHNPPQAPVMPNGSGAWNFMQPSEDESADLKKLIETKGESGMLLDKMAREALNDARGTPNRR